MKVKNTKNDDKAKMIMNSHAILIKAYSLIIINNNEAFSYKITSLQFI
jgi:hypothetical protein